MDSRSLARAALSAGCSGGVMACPNIFLHTPDMEWWRTHLGLRKNEWPDRAHLRERARAIRDLAVKEAHIRHNYALAAAEMAMAHHRHPIERPNTLNRPNRPNRPHNEFTTNWRRYFGIQRHQTPSPAALQTTIRNTYNTLIKRPHTQNDLRKHAFLAEFARRRLKHPMHPMHPMPLTARPANRPERPANRPATRPALGIPVQPPTQKGFQARVKRHANQMKHAWGALKPHLFHAGVMGHRMVQSTWWKKRGQYL